MKISHARRIAPATIAAAALIGSLVAAAPAYADTPPYEPDPSSVGTITFYNAAGAVITSGSTSAAPFAAYAVGSVLPRSTDKQAQLLFANPSSTSTPPYWYREPAGNYSQYPLTTGPANIQTASQTMPVVVGTSGDQNLDAFESDSQISSVAGYQNVVQVRIKTANSANQGTTTYDVADIQIDPVAHTWTQIYPASSTPVTAPGVPAAPTAKSGNAAATVTWAAPSSNGGSPITGYALQKSSDGGATWTDSPHSGTATSQVVTGLTNGTAYSFRVAAENSVGVSDFSAGSTAVTPVADSSSLALTGTKAITYGQSLTVTGTLKDTTTGAVLVGQPITLKQRASSKAAFTTVRTVSTSSKGIASVVVKPTANVQYPWTYAGISTHKAASSAIGGVTVAPTVTIAQNHTSIRRGLTVSFYGTDAPVVTNQKIYLQKLVGSVYKTTPSYGVVKTQKLPNGRTGRDYVITLKLASPGTFRYRAYVPATSARAAGYSAALTIRVT